MIDVLERVGRGGWTALAARFVVVVLAAGYLAPVAAQGIPKSVKDGSNELDVPYEGSHAGVLKAMFEMAKVTRDDFIIDLGSGDGRIVIAAAQRFGARGFGVDLNEKLVAIANQRARRAGIGARARFFVRDIFKTDISRASVVTMFLYPEVVLKLRPKLLGSLAPGARVVSNEYHLGRWRPDAARVVESPGGKEGVVYMWVVPAKLAGLWNWETGYPGYFDRTLRYQAKIKQTFQDMTGEVELELEPMRIHDAAITGARVAFSATGEIDHLIVRHDFAGMVKGNEMAGTVRLSGGVRDIVLPWRAWRARDIIPSRP
ncbi:MAG: class I SAM-dependent methyltransferase [Alphaproteobacteria bacterium]